MADGKLGIPNDVVNILLGLSGSGLAESLGVAAATAGQVVGCLPIVGVVASLLDVWYLKQQCDESHKGKWGKGYNFGGNKEEYYFEDEKNPFGLWGDLGWATRSISAAFLLTASLAELILIQTFTFSLGAASCGPLLPIAYALKSGVDFLGACATLGVIRDECGIKSQKGKAACTNVLAQAMAFAGWTLLACGNPLGWMCLAATIIPHAARLWFGCGVFGKKSQSNSNSYSRSNPTHPNDESSLLFPT
ncbi:MAG: hypothetical protein K0R24_752 [Gammaproteobacteria bacterium]|jgi:hypothetical protein|nr:hypothetical protein [Gammaproteobacteria bacterium]